MSPMVPYEPNDPTTHHVESFTLNCVYEESREPSVDISTHCHNSDGSAVNYLTSFTVRGPKASMAVQLC